MAPGIPFFQCPTSGAQPSNSGFSCGKCTKKMKHGDNSLENSLELTLPCFISRSLPSWSAHPETPCYWQLGVGFIPRGLNGKSLENLHWHAWTPWLPYVTTCYHMLPWFLETLPRTSSALEPRWIRYDVPWDPWSWSPRMISGRLVRSMTLRSEASGLHFGAFLVAKTMDNQEWSRFFPKCHVVFILNFDL